MSTAMIVVSVMLVADAVAAVVLLVSMVIQVRDWR